MGRDTERESASSPQVAGRSPAGGTLSWAEVLRNALSMNRSIESINTAQPRDMGQGTMTGYNNGWGQTKVNM